MPDHNYFANLICQIADLLRRFDCVLASSKAKVLAEHARRKGGRVKGEALDRRLNKAAGQLLVVSAGGFGPCGRAERNLSAIPDA